MKHQIVAILALTIVTSTGCTPAYNPAPSEVLRPQQVLNFEKLYRENCGGCHGSQQNAGAAVELGSAAYLSIADDVTIRRITAEGVPGTAMPAFAQSRGGMLTDEQIDALVKGI